MFGRRCRHRVNELLPFYVNGSLSDEEDRAADEHVKGCAVCRAEVEALEAIADAIRSEPQPILDETPHRLSTGLRAGLAIAASLALALPAFALWRASRGARSSEQAAAAQPAPPPAADAAIVADLSARPGDASGTLDRAAYLDLKGGPTRGDAARPRLALANDEEPVVIALTLPDRPAASERLELADPHGQVVARTTAPIEVDPYGRVTLVVRRSLFRAPGTYSVSLTGAEGVAYAFDVETD